MPPRSSWKGYIKLSLVSVPVQAFTATATGGGEIHLNQLHEECHSRIRYKKVCPIHGEVTGDQIVSGYEYAKGQYVIVEPGELDKLRTESDRAINIDTFIRPDQLDAIFYDGRNYYLVPDTPIGHKPYAVLYQAMVDQGRLAVARVVFSGKEQLVLVRPLEGLLVMTMLSYDSQVRRPASFQQEVLPAEVSPQELKLAEMLIEASSSEEFDIGQYEDLYTQKLTALIEAKVEGKEVVATPVNEETPVINLMEALKQSVARTKPGKAPVGKGVASKAAAGKGIAAQAAAQTVAKPPRKMAASKQRVAAPRKRKSS